MHHWKLLSMLGIGILVLILLPLVYRTTLETYLSDKQTEIVAPTISGRELGERVADFIKSTQRADGSFPLAYECKKENEPCAPIESNEPSYFGYAIMSLFASGNRESADRAVQYALDLCSRDEKLCELNFFAFDLYFQETGDPRYRAAMEKVGLDVLRRALNASQEDYIELARANVPSKLALMYKLTGEERYREALDQVAQGVLGIDFQMEGQKVTFASAYEIHADAPVLVARILVPAYVLTRDTAYKSAVDDFYALASIPSHTRTLLTQQSLWVSVISSLEAFTELYAIESDPITRGQYFDAASLTMQRIIEARFDSPERVLQDGNNNFLATSRGLGRNSSSLFKSINENGGLAYSLMTTLADARFVFPPI